MKFNQLHELRRDILTLDLLYKTYTYKQHGFPAQPYDAEQTAFEAFKAKIINRYGIGLIEMRQTLNKCGFKHEKLVKDWLFIGRTESNLFVWKTADTDAGTFHGKTIYQVTNNEMPPNTDAGYYSLETLLRYKNTRLRTAKNYIIHFQGIHGNGGYYNHDLLKSHRVEMDCRNDAEFMVKLFADYNYIDAKHFYIDGVKADFYETKLQTEVKA